MNVDGSSKNNKGACGGILRSSSGAFLGGFCSHISDEDIVQAELEGIFQGVLFCKQIGSLVFVVETDSTIAYRLIVEQGYARWKYSYLVPKIIWELQDVRRLSLIFREENRVADLFAKAAHHFPARVDVFMEEDLLMFIRKFIFLDRIGIPTFRSPCISGFSFFLTGR